MHFKNVTYPLVVLTPSIIDTGRQHCNQILPVSHLSPMKFSGQSHWNVAGYTTWHVPEFIHGGGSQGSKKRLVRS